MHALDVCEDASDGAEHRSGYSDAEPGSESTRQRGRIRDRENLIAERSAAELRGRRNVRQRRQRKTRQKENLIRASRCDRSEGVGIRCSARIRELHWSNVWK